MPKAKTPGNLEGIQWNGKFREVLTETWGEKMCKYYVKYRALTLELLLGDYIYQFDSIKMNTDQKARYSLLD